MLLPQIIQNSRVILYGRPTGQAITTMLTARGFLSPVTATGITTIFVIVKTSAN